MIVRSFLSYGHVGNIIDDGSLVRLSDDVSQEVTILTGFGCDIETKEALGEWVAGERKRGSSTKDSHIILIPILTPEWCRNETCRQDLLSFQELDGANKTLIPVLYAEIINGRQADEWWSDIIRAEKHDWTQLRQLDNTFPQYRTGVSKIASVIKDSLYINKTVEHEREQILPSAPSWLNTHMFTGWLGSEQTAEVYIDSVKSLYDELGKTQQRLLKFLYRDMHSRTITVDELFDKLRSKHGDDEVKSRSEVFYRCRDLRHQGFIDLQTIGNRTTLVLTRRSVDRAFRKKKILKT